MWRIKSAAFPFVGSCEILFSLCSLASHSPSRGRDTLGTLFTLEDYLNRTVRTQAFVYEWFPNQNAYTQVLLSAV